MAEPPDPVLTATEQLPPESLERSIVGGGAAALIATSKIRVDEALSLPATLTVKMEVPVTVGVPLRTPTVDKLRPAGRVPADTDQLYGVVPPVAANVWL